MKRLGAMEIFVPLSCWSVARVALLQCGQMTRLTVQTRCQAGLAVAMPQETRHDAANSRVKRAIIAGGACPEPPQALFRRMQGLAERSWAWSLGLRLPISFGFSVTMTKSKHFYDVSRLFPVLQTSAGRVRCGRWIAALCSQ